MSLDADKNVLTLGEELTLSAEVTHGKGFKLLELPKDLRLPPFETKRIERIPPRDDGRTVREGYRIVLTVFELGEHTVPSFNVAFLDDKGKRGQVPTDAIKVSVLPVRRTEKDTSDIRPLKSPYRLSPPLDPRTVSLWIFAAVAAAAAVVLGLFFWIRRKRIDPESRLSGAERALLHLGRLVKKGYLESAQAKLFFTEFSEILERYLIEELRIGAAELTTEEFLERVDASALAPEQKALLRQVFRISDLAKFAKWVPPREETLSAVETARRFVEMTRPLKGKEAAVPPEAA